MRAKKGLYWAYETMVVLILVIGFGCSSDRTGQESKEMNAKAISAIQLATNYFKEHQLGEIDDYNVEEVSVESDYWLVLFTPKDLSKAPPGSDVAIAIDKESNKATILSD